MKTPVDYSNSGFTLHNDKLYVESLGDLMQFVYSIDTPRVTPLVEGKQLPPEVMYLLTKEELGRWNNKGTYVYRQDEKIESISYAMGEIYPRYSDYASLWDFIMGFHYGSIFR